MPNEFIGDFSNVKDSGGINPKRVPEGDYRAKIIDVRDHNSKAGKANWLYVFQLEGLTGCTYPYYCALDVDSLWKIRNLYSAAGINIPKKKVKLTKEQLKGKVVGITLEDDEYDGKQKSVIAAVIPASDVESDTADAADDDVEADTDEVEEDEVEETPAPAAKEGKTKAAPAAVADDDLEELELEEL